MRVLILPPPDLKNPYFRRLLEGLRARRIAYAGIDILTIGELRRMMGETRVVHIHWVEFVLWLNVPGRRAWVSSVVALARLLPALLMCGRFGVRLVWTVHNAEPHESHGRWRYNLAARVLARQADVIHVHSAEAATAVARRYHPRGELVVQPQGAYQGDYQPPSDTREALRTKAGIAAEQFVFLSFGQIRAYKRVPELISAIRDLPSNVALVVAGSATDEMAEELRWAAGEDDRIHLHLRYVDDRDVATYHTVADAAVLNYERILNSGALLLSLGFSLPAVVPYEGTSEIAGLPGGESALERFRPGGLSDALRAVLRSDVEARHGAARQIAERFSWDSFVDGLVKAYQGS